MYKVITITILCFASILLIFWALSYNHFTLIALLAIIVAFIILPLFLIREFRLSRAAKLAGNSIDSKIPAYKNDPGVFLLCKDHFNPGNPCRNFVGLPVAISKRGLWVVKRREHRFLSYLYPADLITPDQITSITIDKHLAILRIIIIISTLSLILGYLIYNGQIITPTIVFFAFITCFPKLLKCRQRKVTFDTPTTTYKWISRFTHLSEADLIITWTTDWANNYNIPLIDNITKIIPPHHNKPNSSD